MTGNPEARYAEAPRDVAALRMRMKIVANQLKTTQVRLEVMLASVVVTQLVSDVVVKGGIALKVRGGDRATRFTTDVDVARRAGVTIDEFLAALRSQCAQGWGGFTATVAEGRSARAPRTVPVDYVMRPFMIKLAYRGKSFKTVTFEVVHDEIDSMSAPAEWRMSPDVADVVSRLGLPEPGKVRVLPAPYQIAQKLHACTAVGVDGTNDRAHDLVDIMLLVDLDKPDVGDIGRVGRRVVPGQEGSSVAAGGGRASKLGRDLRQGGRGPRHARPRYRRGVRQRADHSGRHRKHAGLTDGRRCVRVPRQTATPHTCR